YALGSILGQGRPQVVDGQLIVEGEIMAETDAARQVMGLAAAGYQWQASVGADVTRAVRFAADQATTANGQTITGPVRVVRASTLRETSFVTLGADRSTAVSIAAEDAAEESTMAADANTKPADEVLDTPAVAATADVAVGQSPEQTIVADATRDLEEQVGKLKERLDDMTKLLATRDERPAPPAVHVVTPAQPTAEVIEASFAMQGGLPNVEAHYDDKVLEAAHKARRELSLGEVLLRAAEENNYDGPRRITSATLRPILAAAWASHDISGILSATVNKFLLAGFDGVEQAWRQISATRAVNDFKTITSYRLNGGFKFDRIPNGGELKNAAASEEERTISADTYGIMTSVTRTDLINDDLGALTAVPQRIGRGGALKLNDVFWASFLDDASFFTTARKNLMTSGTTPAAGALSLANLKNVVKTFRKLKDPDGNPLAVEPRILMVPVDLEVDALEIMGSSLIQSGNTAGQPERNVLAGRYQVVASTYLTNVTDYYLLASPADLPVMEVAFLNGVQSPIVETADADFNVLGIQMRGYFDFGVSKAEYLAGVKVDV
ncbi:MAG TPA: Mu-like prophage major head subunit gpT family protein, partial [Acidimicrobiia bacterium]